jgi:hypothetical protein
LAESLVDDGSAARSFAQSFASRAKRYEFSQQVAGERKVRARQRKAMFLIREF